MQGTDTTPSRRSKLALAGVFCTVFGAAFSTASDAAMTMGVISGIERTANIVYISGERLSVTSKSRLVEVPQAGGDELPIDWQAVNVGDYVLFESDGKVLKRLQRVPADSIDAPPAVPMQSVGNSGRK